MLAMFLLIDTGLMAPVRGWLRRAERLLTGMPETPPHALIAMVRTYERFMCGDMDAVREQAARAIELGERHGVAPAVVIGRVAIARVTLLDGDIEGGLDQLDEVATVLMSGDVDPLTTGMMYCELICAAQGLALHDRAIEWTGGDGTLAARSGVRGHQWALSGASRRTPQGVGAVRPRRGGGPPRL